VALSAAQLAGLVVLAGLLVGGLTVGAVESIMWFIRRR